MNIISNNEIKIIFEEQTNNTHKAILKIPKRTSYIFNINVKRGISISFSDTFTMKEYVLRLHTQYLLMYTSQNYDILITIKNLYSDNNVLENIYNTITIYEYGNPIKIMSTKYQVVYSFDKKYLCGAFASIFSLIHNFDKKSLHDININIVIGDDDVDEFQKEFNKLILEIKSVFQYSIYVLTNEILNDCVLETKCYKGGNHLLKQSNFARLVIGHVINSDKILYLDSDTIIQSDVSICLDNTPVDFILMGKKSTLTYKNLLNDKNLGHVGSIINNFDASKSVIYTGTLIINPNKYRDFYPKIIEIIKLHNSLDAKGGLYKLFTMSILNLAYYDVLQYSDDILCNVVDLGHNENIPTEILDSGHVLDWSGILKPWYMNGLYREYWKKYNLIYDKIEYVTKIKDTVEKFS